MDTTKEDDSKKIDTEIMDLVTKDKKMVDLESGLVVDDDDDDDDDELVKNKGRKCRICHLSFDDKNRELLILPELGCSCKGDLAVAHNHCAQAWFNIRGNKTCEICGSLACNVVDGGLKEVVVEDLAALPRPEIGEGRSFWQGYQLLNFILAFIVFASVLSWLFRLNLP